MYSLAKVNSTLRVFWITERMSGRGFWKPWGVVAVALGYSAGI